MTLVANTFDLTPANLVLNKLDQNFAQMMIVAVSGRKVGQTGAVATLAPFTVGANDGTFEFSCNILVTNATNHSFAVALVYTDEGGTGRGVTVPFILVAGSAIVNTIANANGAVPYMSLPFHFRAKAGTAITIATAGTFTNVTYNFEAVIKQLM